jgi:predicted nucleic acid-binding protein
VRYVLDTSTALRIIDDSALLNKIQRLVESGTLELLVPATARRELLAGDCPGQADAKEQLLGLCRPVPDGGFIVGTSAVGESRIGDPYWIEVLRQRKPKHNNDALIASATRFEDASLLTGDDRQARQTQKLMRSAPTLENLLRRLDDTGTSQDSARE